MVSDSQDLVGRAYAVTKIGGRIVAVARTGGGWPEGDGAAWYSDDGGASWQPITGMEDVLGGAGDQSLNAILTYDQGLVAVGHDTGHEREVHSSVWKSSDGLSWSRVASATQWTDPDRDTEMRGLVQYGQRYVSVGSSRFGGSREYAFELGYGAQESDYDAAVWLADTLSSWQRIVCDEALCGGKADQILNDIASGPKGFVIVGSEKLNGKTHGAVWVS